jgi:hypothetical protein
MEFFFFIKTVYSAYRVKLSVLYDTQNKHCFFPNCSKHLVFVTETQWVFSEVGTELLNIVLMNSVLKELK